jgi:hypothetical protein
VFLSTLKSSRRTIAGCLRVAACVVGIAMLLSFPAVSAHLYGQHFRTTEIRQNIVRHTFVAGPESGSVEQFAHLDAQPSISMPVIIDNVAKRSLLLATASDVPTFRLLHRFKLGPSRSGGSDPLL